MEKRRRLRERKSVHSVMLFVAHGQSLQTSTVASSITSAQHQRVGAESWTGPRLVAFLWACWQDKQVVGSAVQCAALQASSLASTIENAAALRCHCCAKRYLATIPCHVNVRQRPYCKVNKENNASTVNTRTHQPHTCTGESWRPTRPRRQ
jgi:hypothetical protein